ncbi:organic cation/carnitine transporter 2-like [Panicum virgatum]|nr:organic cation/carnitine transporter 2-like [Panicum virgatum]
MADDDTPTAPLLTSHKAKPAEVPSIDDIIETCIGGTGAMQLLKAFLVVFARAFDGQLLFISVFTEAEPRWHCVVAGGDSSSCSRPAAAASPCALPPGTWAWDRPAGASVVSEWGLNCAGPALVSLPSSAFFAGCLAGGFLLTMLADSLLGRKKMLVAALASMSVAGALTALAPNVWAYAALRFASGFARSMVGTCALVLSTELVGKRWRNAVSFVAFSCFTLGFLSLPAVAYALREVSWRSVYFWTSLPCLLYAVLLYFLAQESPRWLLVRGRTQEAVETLRQIASRNGGGGGATAGSSSSLSMLQNACALAMYEDSGTRAGGVFVTLQAILERRWAIQRLAAIMAAGFGVGVVYFGMPLSVGSLGPDLYLSVAYNAASELPSAVLSWFVIARANRRGALAALAAAAGACSLACVAIPRGAEPARLAAELLSFSATSTAYNVILIYAIELFPTSLRNSALGLVRQAMVLGGVVAPVLVALGRERSFWSFGVFGLAIGCSGLFAACLPETRGRSLSDTMEEEERKQAAGSSAAVDKNSDDSHLV